MSSEQNEIILPPLTQSAGLSQRHVQMNQDGRHLTDDSKHSEKTLEAAMKEIKVHAQERLAPYNAVLLHAKTISLYECQTYFQAAGGPPPNPENKGVYMKPDGGILFAEIGDKKIPLLITEDKVQGTNDVLFQQNKPRQATGNAIERGAKNIRGSEMIFASRGVFPYAIFASGCDFHPTETIAKRLEMMNMGFPNHSIALSPTTTEEEVAQKVATIVDSINIQKKCEGSMAVASVFVKSHKWNEMAHGSSKWSKDEIVQIGCRMVDLSIAEFVAKASSTQDT